MKAPQGKATSPFTLLNPCSAGSAIRRNLTGRVPLYKRGKIAKWFQQVPPFIKGGLGGILHESLCMIHFVIIGQLTES